MTREERAAKRKAAKDAKAERLQNQLFPEWLVRAVFAPPGDPLHSRINYGQRFDDLSFRTKVACMRHYGGEDAARKVVDEAAAKVAAERAKANLSAAGDGTSVDAARARARDNVRDCLPDDALPSLREVPLP